MAKTKSFKDLVQGQVKTDKKFAEALLREGVDAMLSGDVETGKTILRDYIKATVGFEKLGEATDTPPKSPIRMFGPRGNPQAKNLFSVIGYLQKRAGVQLHVSDYSDRSPGWSASEIWGRPLGWEESRIPLRSMRATPAARHHQSNGRLREAWQGHRHSAEEPHPHVRPARQSAGQEPVQRDWLLAEARGRAATRERLVRT